MAPIESQVGLHSLCMASLSPLRLPPTSSHPFLFALWFLHAVFPFPASRSLQLVGNFYQDSRQSERRSISRMTRLFPSAGPTAELFSSFTFDQVIGEGQFGRVWRCVHVASGSWFACKKIRKSRLSAHDLDSLRNEVASMERLRGHRHVLQLLALFEDEKTVYMVTDLCDAGDMFALVSKAKGLPEQAAAVVFSQIAEAVRWCHVHGIVHRDIKPENVLLVTRTSDNGRKQLEACLGDFGLALQIPEGFMIRGAAGSAPYEAPEVVASEAYSVTADVWSLGVLLYAMLSAKLPSFPASSAIPATPHSPSSTLSPHSPASPSSPLSPSASDTFPLSPSSPSSSSSPEHPRHRRHYKLSPLAS
ncbi:unnamed protein product [Closterium sp. Yama58-4]|nr:unnamed protein product [Closterium sp. Yama58-4]